MEGLSKRDLAQLMVGRSVVFAVEKKPSVPGRCCPASAGRATPINNKGVAGAARRLAGCARRRDSGHGRRLRQRAERTGRSHHRPARMQRQHHGQRRGGGNQPPITAISSGVSHVPEDRTHVGSAPNMSITDNTIMKCYREAAGRQRDEHQFQHGRRNWPSGLKDAYDILAPSVETLARKLSGGNLQKVILAREISSNPQLMIAVQPTRGLDVGAIEAIQNHLLAQREAGTAILLVSEELDELLALSDRIAVIYEGEIMGTVERGRGHRRRDRLADDRFKNGRLKPESHAIPLIQERGTQQCPSILSIEKRVEDPPKWMPAATSIGSVAHCLSDQRHYSEVDRRTAAAGRPFLL